MLSKWYFICKVLKDFGAPLYLLCFMETVIPINAPEFLNELAALLEKQC